MLSAPSQVLVRNAELFAQGNWALVNPTDPDVFSALGDTQLTGLHQYFDVFQLASGVGSTEHVFEAVFSTHSQYEGAVVYMPKAKQHARMLLANIASLIKPGGQLMVVGENKAGIKSAAKLLADFGSRVNKIDSARHCSLFCVQLDGPAEAFAIDHWLTSHQVNLGKQSFELVTLPGVFSHGELDMGTHLLLSSCNNINANTILDFACGAGVIGIYLALENPGLKVTMSDINALALHCARINAQANQIDVTVIPSNGLDQIDGKFDGVYTNPPFHTGVSTDYSITEQFIRSVKHHLNGNGELVLVANRFLKYPDILEQSFGSFSVIGQTGKFNLYKATS